MKKESTQSAVPTPKEKKKMSAKRLPGSAARAYNGATIKFGTTAIAVKLYTAVSSESVAFNNLHKGCGERTRQQTICPVHNEVLKTEDIVKGYAHEKGSYVAFTDQELRDLDPAHADQIVLEEFVPAETVDFIFIEKTCYLGPDDGGDRGYRLLADVMTETQLIAVGRWGTRGKRQLVLVRPYKDGLVMHPIFYATEVRNFDDVYRPRPNSIAFDAREIAAAAALIADLSSDRFRPEKYKDDYRDRVIAAADKKAAGQSLTPDNLAPIKPASLPSADEGVG